MAGFLGMGNYSKPGKGVKKNGTQKKRFFYFFDLLFRKIIPLIKLNLTYLLFCIPIITIGPATAALMKITKEFVREKPVFLFSDFKDAFKENFKQGFIVFILEAIIGFGLVEGFIFYYVKTFQNSFYWVILILLLVTAMIFIILNFYTYLMMSTVDIPLVGLIKNSIIMVFVGAKTNFITLFFVLLIAVPCFLFFPFTIILLILGAFSITAMIIAYNSYQYIDKYLVKPYYIQNNIKNPDEVDEEDKIFEDVT